MWWDDLVRDLESSKNPDKIPRMEGYMRNKFSFLGLYAGERRELARPYFKEAVKLKRIDWDFVYDFWERDYREFQYLTIDYLREMEGYLVEEDIKRLEYLIVNKSWWDSVDNLSVLVGLMVDKFEGLKENMLDWSLSDNIWLRRMSIIYQLRLKDRTDLDMLSTTIDNNLGSEEFFINKAIGWGLREYSKTDKAWVKNFLEARKTRLNSLSIREASKYID